jgi:hypothetical protein
LVYDALFIPNKNYIAFHLQATESGKAKAKNTKFGAYWMNYMFGENEKNLFPSKIPTDLITINTNSSNLNIFGF